MNWQGNDNLSATLRKMNFNSSEADCDLLMRDTGNYHEYIATYIDDFLVFSKQPMEVIDTIWETYKLKKLVH